MTRESRPATVIVECDFSESPEKLWKALTVPELLAKWLGPNDVRPEVGRRFRLEPDIECEVLEAEPNRRLRLSWRERPERDRDGDDPVRDDRCSDDRDGEESAVDSIVTFELTRTVTGGTRLRLVHEGFEAQARAPAAQWLMAA